ncbi:MAG: hypothetical protein GC154_08725 [bacterium]|nr:hypothetical protein [bacterium]
MGRYFARMIAPPIIVLFALLGSIAAFAQDQPTATPAWFSGFEKGFPGEFLNYDNGSYTKTGVSNAGKYEAWTIQSDFVFSGSHAYKGWLSGANDASTLHRAYPVLHSEIPSPLVNSFMVYLDVDYAKLGGNWMHLATWGNNPDWEVHTLSVRNRKLEMAHLDWKYIGPRPQPDFPLRQWVRITAYIWYPPEGDGTVFIWQDGVPMLSGTYTARQGKNLMRSHWGMYAPAGVASGTHYNDDIEIWTLSGPWADFSMEPPSPYARASVEHTKVFEKPQGN